MPQSGQVRQNERERFQQIRQEWLDCVERQRNTAAQAVCLRAFAAIANGRALPLAEVAAHLRLAPEQFQALIEQLARQGRLTLDETGTAIAGAAGLSLFPSRHTLILNGRRLFTWCALDAVGIPAGLGADARVLSQCMHCGAPIHVTISEGKLAEMSPASLSIAIVPPDESRAVRDGICTEMGFSCGCQRATNGERLWISVEDAMELGRDCWRADAVPV